MQPTLPLALILLFCGLFILGLELFLPSAGILFVMAMSCVIASVWVGFQVGTSTGLSILIMVFVLALILPGIGIQLWKRSPIGRRIFLPEADDPALAAGPIIPALESWVGKSGRTLTTLRPSGLVQLEDQRVDAISDGPVIDRGKLVRVVGIRGSRVLVHQEGDIAATAPGTPTTPGTPPAKPKVDFEDWESIDDLTK